METKVGGLTMSDKQINLLSSVVFEGLKILGNNQPVHVQEQLDALFDAWQDKEDKIELVEKEEKEAEKTGN